MTILNIYKEFHSNLFDLTVDHYGAEICKPSYSFGPSVRTNYVLHFIVHGKGSFTIDNTTTQLSEGDIFILPKNKITFYQADQQNPWSYLWVGFSGSKANAILKKSQLLDAYFLHSHLESKVLEQMMLILRFSEEKLTHANELALNGELYKLLANLIAEFPSHTNSHDNLTKYYLRQVIKIIHTQYDTPLKVSDIAARLNLNRSYLYKIFKAETGYSIKDYIIQVKMQKSVELLHNPNLNITDISNSVGFTNPLTFSKVFKNHFQTSPKKYREQLTQKE